MRSIKGIHKAVYEPIADLVTYRAMPTPSVPMNALDPFIFLNHHGWQEYSPDNNGLPFGPHPHRGFETVTFILEGDLTHKDSSGAESIIKAGGVEWMTAGSGLIHAEVSSEAFKEKGGPLEILQLWVNLPAKYKMTEPTYSGLQKEEIPVAVWDDGKVHAQIIAGTWNGIGGTFHPLTDIHLACIEMKQGGAIEMDIPMDKTIFLYIVKGEVTVDGKRATLQHLVELDNNETGLGITADYDSTMLLGYATPFKEPFVAYGPFVMNTPEEIQQAYEDYRHGKFGDEDDF